MASQSNTAMPPDAEIVEEIAAELGISSAFVEKDWYSVQALKAVAEHESDDFLTIFSGGTSLSKRYGLIQRFSEDLVAVACNYVKFELGYPQNHDTSAALRASLQIEFSFTQPRLEAEIRQIQSFVSYYADADPEVEILCLSPIEKAADKLSALTWRVLKRD